MSIDFEDLFPEGLTDETARAISELLHQVADHFDRTFIDGAFQDSCRVHA